MKEVYIVLMLFAVVIEGQKRYSSRSYVTQTS